MKELIAAVFLAAAGEVDVAPPPSANGPRGPEVGACDTYERVAELLASDYGELGTGQSLVEGTGTAVEVFINPLGTLTVVEVYPDQTTCYRAFNTQQGKWHRPPPGRQI